VFIGKHSSPVVTADVIGGGGGYEKEEIINKKEERGEIKEREVKRAVEVERLKQCKMGFKK
jgi:hypothetical protein